MDIHSLTYSTSTSTSPASFQENVTGDRPQQASVVAVAQTASQGLATGLQAALPSTQTISHNPELLAAAIILLDLGQASRALAQTTTQATDFAPRQPQPPETQMQYTTPDARGNLKPPQTPDVFIDIPDDVSTSSTVSDLTNPHYSHTAVDEKDTPPPSSP